MAKRRRKRAKIDPNLRIKLPSLKQLEQFIKEHQIKPADYVTPQMCETRLHVEKPQIMLHRDALLRRLAFQISALKRQKKTKSGIQ